MQGLIKILPLLHIEKIANHGGSYLADKWNQATSPLQNKGKM